MLHRNFNFSTNTYYLLISHDSAIFHPAATYLSWNRTNTVKKAVNMHTDNIIILPNMNNPLPSQSHVNPEVARKT